MKIDDDAAGTWIIVLFIVWLIYSVGSGPPAPNRCGAGMHEETYVRAGGAEHDVCVWD